MKRYDKVVFRSIETAYGTIARETQEFVILKHRNGSVQTIPRELIVSIQHKDLNY